MARRAFASELEQAADNIADANRADLQILLRRAALRVRNTEGVAFDPEIDQAIDLLAGALKLHRSEVVQSIVRDWLVGAGRLHADTLDEESETDGTS
jgi:hypothetical protein